MAISKRRFESWKENDLTIHEMFRRAVAKTPHKVALVDGEVSITYNELDNLSDRFASYLRKSGVGSGKVVGVYLENCYEYIIACIAILKIGCAYLHLDLNYKRHIIDKILQEVAPIAVVTKSKYQNKFSMARDRKLFIEKRGKWDVTYSKDNHLSSMSSSQSAFIGYSSGTTGAPKGIKVSHKAALYAISKFWEEVSSLRNISNFAYATYLSWDAMGPLIFNSTGHIIPNGENEDPAKLVQYMEKYKINQVFFTPSLLKNLLQEIPQRTIRKSLASLTVMWLGGEVVTQDLVKKTLFYLPNVRLINNYGPSECFVVAQGRITKKDASIYSLPCPVGRVLPEMDILIVDKYMGKVDPGKIGELLVSGPCLADGYLNSPDLTHQKFISLNSKTYYKTGDLAYIQDDGRLVIQGRASAIVSIDNENVDLVKVQSAIKKFFPLEDCIVIFVDGKLTKPELVCFYVKDRKLSSNINQNDIKKTLNSTLPKYMMPKKFIKLSKIPISDISQKVDYQKLYKIAKRK